ncbi:cbl-interacting protein kinase 5, partial [Phtheirospermum japonicum]
RTRYRPLPRRSLFFRSPPARTYAGVPQSGVQQTVLSKVAGKRAQPEIGDFQLAVFVKEEVLGLQITMVNAATVAEIDGGDQLLKVVAGGVLAEPAPGDLGEELAAADELHGEVDLGLAGHDLVELDNVGVALHHLHDRDLALHLFHHTDADHFLLADDLHRHALAGQQVPGRGRPSRTCRGRGGGRARTFRGARRIYHRPPP